LACRVVEVTIMHVLIFAPTPSAAAELQAALDDAAERCTIAVTWLDVVASLDGDPPDLALIERAALSRLEPGTLLNLMGPGCWPPLVLVDTPAASAGLCPSPIKLGSSILIRGRSERGSADVGSPYHRYNTVCCSLWPGGRARWSATGNCCGRFGGMTATIPKLARIVAGGLGV